MAEELDDILRNVANIVYDRVKQFGIADRAYERAMSEELLDRGLRHEAHKRVYDDRKGKFKFIDLFFPDYRRFAKLKARKYITRIELNELRDEEQVLGIEGMIINFYNGVTIRYSRGGRTGVGEEVEFVPPYAPHPIDIQRSPKPRTTLPHLSSSTGRISEIGEPTNAHRSHKNLSRYPMTVPPLTEEKESFKNSNKIFALSCAAFFLSEGDRRQFSSIFGDLMETMKLPKINIPDKFLEGPKLKTPDGELISTLKSAFENCTKETSKPKSRNISPLPKDNEEKINGKEEIDDTK